MNICKKLLFGICLALTSCFYFTSNLAQVQMITEEEYKSMSPAERQEYEQQLRQQIEQMSPVEQEAFAEDAVQQMFDSLTPEQQKTFLKKYNA